MVLLETIIYATINCTMSDKGSEFNLKAVAVRLFAKFIVFLHQAHCCASLISRLAAAGRAAIAQRSHLQASLKRSRIASESANTASSASAT